MRGDVCIVGTGPAGLTLALELERSGLQIIMIEAGGPQVEPSTQDAYGGEVVNPVHPPSQMYRQRRLGGSSGIWGGRCTPLDELDFVERDHVPFSGWPFPRSEVSPYYSRAQDAVEVGDYDYHAATALDDKPLIEGFRDAYVQTSNIERYSPPTRFWPRYREALIRSRNVTVVTGASCIRFDAGDNHAVVQAAECVGKDGRRFTVSARSFVAAVGGLETVRLLEFSKLGLGSGWLGRNYMCHVEINFAGLRLVPHDRGVVYGFEKSSDGIYVKRRFTLSSQRQAQLGILNAAARIHHPSILDPDHRDPVLSALFLARKFIIPEYARHFSIANGRGDAGKYSLVDTNPVIRAVTERQGFFGQHVRNVALGLPGLTKFGASWIAQRYIAPRKVPYIALRNANGSYALNIYGEQAPNRDSRVMLGDTVDQNGVPRLKIDWRAQDIDYRTLAYTIREIRRALEESGCGTIEFDDQQLDEDVRAQTVPVGGHHIGTARMSDDPRQGVVDRNGLVHGTSNLYVAGAATFPTSGQANPTLTIVALSLRLADHLGHSLSSNHGARAIRDTAEAQFTLDQIPS
ncbi:FAD-dependent oxidoreductase [Sphingomonas sp.]|uniref:FAD-dependent oxidoreductase n=1 Tax=Sphingomonas sp. TaxID=28214 RepID=UPI003B3A1BC4